MDQKLKYPIILACILSLAFSKRKKPELVTDYLSFNHKKFEKSFVLVPEKTVKNYFWDDTTKRRFDSYDSNFIHVDSFYIFQTELTNEGYREFLHRTIQAGDTELYELSYPDSAVWRTRYSYHEPFSEYYFLNPALNHYPVVGVSHKQAKAYCEWLTREYRKIKNRKFKNAVFKLPTSEQWLMAGLGKDPNNNRILPWDGLTDVNEKGQVLANFVRINQTLIERNSDFFEDPDVRSDNFSEYLKIESMGDYTLVNHVKPVVSHPPNDIGLYNMVGNVSEYVRESGFTKGGSWHEPGAYLLLNSEDHLWGITENSSASHVGFRIVMELVSDSTSE